MKLIMENWRKFVDSCEAESRLIEEKKKRTKKKKKRKKSFPDLTGDGKVTRADILKGRGVIDEEEVEEGKKCPHCYGNAPISKCICGKVKEASTNKSTNKYDNSRALKGDQDGLPDHLQKAIIDKVGDDLPEGKGSRCPKCNQVIEGSMEEHRCGGETKKESAFSGNGPLGEPIEEKKRKKKKKRKSKSSRCTGPTKKASSTRKGKKWMRCVKSDSGGYKRIHWGQAGVRVTGKSGNTKRKKSFKARHGCSSAKSNTPKGQACKDWAEE